MRTSSNLIKIYRRRYQEEEEDIIERGGNEIKIYWDKDEEEGQVVSI